MESSLGDVFRLGPIKDTFDKTVADWMGADGTSRVWKRDTSLWSGGDEDRWLAWLDAVVTHRSSIDQINALVEDVRQEGITDVLLLGMGGSSLCPEVVAETFGQQDGYPTLHVLDSTVPDQVRRFRSSLELSRTLVIVASKSGTTVEPNVLLDYFVDELAKEVETVGKHLVAVTDPGSDLEAKAKAEGYRAIFSGVSEIGGRFSALSCFGLLPAGLVGVDLNQYLDRAEEMADSCKQEDQNRGALLGAALGAAWADGRDKVSLVLSPGLWDIGAWIEQLVAESTGKEGIGICPIDAEPPLPADAYQNDRIFVYIRSDDGADAEQDAQADTLVEAGHPVVTLKLRDVYDLSAEFFRWEFATAVAGSLMRINPFDQPNVQESKDITSVLLEAFERDGALPEPNLVGKLGSLVITSYDTPASPQEAVDQLLGELVAGDYFTISAYCDRTEQAQNVFAELRALIATTKRVATTLGYGPRFLHSTGQLHKGGQNRGVFLIITAAPEQDLDIPGKRASFGVLSRAQALGDYQALVDKGRRVVRLDLLEGLESGLREVKAAVQAAL